MKSGCCGQFEIERGNGEHAKGKQQPLHPPPCQHGARTVVRIDAAETCNAQTILHVDSAFGSAKAVGRRFSISACPFLRSTARRRTVADHLPAL
jgi:hypothetical protein